MEVKSAEFVSSHASLDKLPPPVKHEFAFIGRSNVGKSSLLNMLCGRKGLAKISSTPGKTQTINHFIINGLWYLVDLPGYGYAKTSKSRKELWQNFTFNYLEKRTNLMCTFVLIDVRLKPQKIDMEFMEWLAVKEIPFAMVFTKSDKLTANHVNTNVTAYKNFMLQTWDDVPHMFVTSSEKSTGKTELLDFINLVIDETPIN